MMVISLFALSPVVKTLYPAGYMVGHMATTAAMMGAL